MNNEKLDVRLAELAAAQKRAEAIRKDKKRKGGSLMSSEDRLSYQKIPGYRTYLESDERGAVERRLSEGYTFVTDEDIDTSDRLSKASAPGSIVNQVVGTDDRGNPIHGVLMKMPEDLYTEREKAYNAKVDRSEQAIVKTGSPQGAKAGDYGEVTITR